MKQSNTAFIYEETDLSLIPERKRDANKGSTGHALIIAGAEGMSGAAFLSALAAYRTGAGLVRIFTPEANRMILQIGLPEAITTAYDPGRLVIDEDGCAVLPKGLLSFADVIVLGPGLGRAPYVLPLVKAVMKNGEAPLILDADALNTIAAEPELRKLYRKNMVITPHVGEMARLTGKKIPEILASMEESASQYRDLYGINCLLKSHESAVALTDGRMFRTLSGTPALAKGGSGDVLTGIIAGLVCIGMELPEAAAFGSFLHGLAGREAEKELSVHGILAREIAEALPAVMRREE